MRDDPWMRLASLVPGGHKRRQDRRSNNLRFLDALLWMARSGARWRDVPPHPGWPGTRKRHEAGRRLDQGFSSQLRHGG
ncbi:MAG: transposase [Rhodospirillaceae bacterium]|nr:transposase [Rhodospirillaceae bacterium]MBT4687594.1 transposase [Rhodospirillaceae bacterium]MBT5082046.1 transposase [Rhodospirillaceae bacterium]MBT5524746.1 transposase [Rhodospirillaceae bacterium]MBT5881213.1 transposase [Rhodospirillaceae bacterium]